MKTKEDIFEQLQNENPHSIPVFKAMDEYAKERAIAFARWIADREGDQRMTLVDHNWYFEADTDGDNILTEEELFKQFLEENPTDQIK